MTDLIAEPRWPTHGPECGTELAADLTGGSPAQTPERAEGAPYAFIAKELCPNPRCPAKQQNAPGSLGGDNGGG